MTTPTNGTNSPWSSYVSSDTPDLKALYTDGKDSSQDIFENSLSKDTEDQAQSIACFAEERGFVKKGESYITDLLAEDKANLQVMTVGSATLQANHLTSKRGANVQVVAGVSDATAIAMLAQSTSPSASNVGEIIKDSLLEEQKDDEHRFLKIGKFRSLPADAPPQFSINVSNVSGNDQASIPISITQNVYYNQQEAQKRNEQNKLIDQRPIENLPSKLPFFTGREKELETLERSFLTEKPLPTDSVVRLIYGLGGMGKTELTRAFARAHRDNFSMIWFINSETAEKQRQSYRELVDELIEKMPEELAKKRGLLVLDRNDPKEVKRKIYAHLKNHSFDKPWILIYDDVKKEFIPPQGGYVLMTSRKKDVWKNHVEQIELFEFKKEDAEKILSDITKKKSTCIPELAELLGYFPLALQQAANYIVMAKCSIEDYLTELKKNPFNGEMKSSKHYKLTLKTVWQMTFKLLEEKNQKAFSWLEVCSHLNPDDISSEWLADWLDKQPNTQNWNKIKINEALINFSLIRSKSEGVYAMHILVQGAIRETRGAKKKFIEAFELVKRKWGNFQDWKQAQKWITHASTIKNSLFFQNFDKETQTDTLDLIGSSLGELGQYHEALKHHQIALKIRGKVLPPDYPNLATSYNYIGLSLRKLGRYQEAFEYQLKALKIQKEMFSPDPPNLAMNYNNISLSLSNLGRYQEALEYQREALKIRKKMTPLNFSSLAMNYNNIGLNLGNLGRYQEALEYQREALKIQKEIFSSDHPNIARSHNNIGSSLCKLGQYQKAFEHQQRALEMWEKVFPPDHPDLARSYNYIGVTLCNLGQHDEALKHQLRALEIQKKVLPHDHPDLATTHNNVGLSLNGFGRYQEALKHLQKALMIREKVLPPKHPDLAASYKNVGLSLCNLGRNKEAFVYLQKALKIIYTTHSADSYNNAD